jgi:integrase
MRGDGRIYKRGKEGKEIWWIGFYGPTAAGWGQIRESTGIKIASGADSRDRAKKILGRRLREVENSVEGIKDFSGPAQRRVTVGELLDALELYHETVKPKSLRQARTAIRHIRARFGNLRAAAVTPKLVRDYVAERMKAGAKPSTINRATEKLARAYSLGIEDGRIAFAPKIVALKEDNARQGTITAADFKKRMTHVTDQDFRDYFEWLYWSGARPGGAAAMTWASFDREGWTITLEARIDKTSTAIKWALTGPFREIIERRLKRRRLDSNLIFFYETKTKLPRAFVTMKPNGTTIYHYTETWRTAGEDAKVPDFETYALRRTAITNNRRAGIPPKVCMALSGHSTTSTFHRYSIVDEVDLRDAAEKRAVYEAQLPAESSERR